MKSFSCTLPHAPGVNAQYRGGARRNGSVYLRLTAEALIWLAAAINEIKREIDPLDEGKYWIAVTYNVFVCQQDTDACAKLLHDGIEAALGLEQEQVQDYLNQRLKAKDRPTPHRWVNDANYVQFGVKTPLPRTQRDRQKIELEVFIVEVQDDHEFGDLSTKTIQAVRAMLRRYGSHKVMAT